MFRVKGLGILYMVFRIEDPDSGFVAGILNKYQLRVFLSVLCACIFGSIHSWQSTRSIMI